MGGMFVQAIPPTQKSGGDTSPPPSPPGFTPVTHARTHTHRHTHTQTNNDRLVKVWMTFWECFTGHMLSSTQSHKHTHTHIHTQLLNHYKQTQHRSCRNSIPHSPVPARMQTNSHTHKAHTRIRTHTYTHMHTHAYIHTHPDTMSCDA